MPTVSDLHGWREEQIRAVHSYVVEDCTEAGGLNPRHRPDLVECRFYNDILTVRRSNHTTGEFLLLRQMHRNVTITLSGRDLTLSQTSHAFAVPSSDSHDLPSTVVCTT